MRLVIATEIDGAKFDTKIANFKRKIQNKNLVKPFLT